MFETDLATDLMGIVAPSRKGRVETYLYDYGDEVSAAMAEDFYCHEKPVANYGILIPVAAHQEAAMIVPAMAEYAYQEDAEPFTIFLLLNQPNDADYERVKETYAELEKAKELFPWLDIRVSEFRYEETIIGQVRKDLWDAALRVALGDGLYDTDGGEFFGLNHDIDTIKISPHYMRNVQAHYGALQDELYRGGLSEDPLPMRATQVKHAYPFDTHPNIAKYVLWYDLTFRQMFRAGSYEEGQVIPFSFYAKRGGFNPRDKTYETHVFTNGGDNKGIFGTGLDTSPRRFIERLQENSPAEIWTDDSFGANDPCREPGSLAEDITFEELEELIFESLEADLIKFCRSVSSRRWESMISGLAGISILESKNIGDYRSTTARFARDLVRPRLILARKVLERVIGSDLLASLVDEDLIDNTVEKCAGEVQAHAEKEKALMLKKRLSASG